MSEKSTAVKLAVIESVEKSKEAVCEYRESKEHCSKKEQDLNKKPMEDTKKMSEKVTEMHETETWQSIKTTLSLEISTSNKSENLNKLEAIQVRQIPKSKISTSNKLENPGAMEIFQMRPNTSEISTSIQVATPQVPKVCQMLETTSEATSIKLEAPQVLSQVPKVSQMSKFSIFDKSDEDCKALEICQVSKTMSEISTSICTEVSQVPEEILKVPETCKKTKMSKTFVSNILGDFPQVPQVCEKITSKITPDKSTSSKCQGLEIPELCQMAKTAVSDTCNKIKEFQAPEVRRTRSMSKISTCAKTEVPEISKALRTCNTASKISVPIKFDHVEEIHETYSAISKMDETNLAKNVKNDNSKIHIQKLEEENLGKKSFDGADKRKMISVNEENEKSIRDMRYKIWPPISMPNFKEPHLVLATHHIVPSLPIGLFEIFAEMIEVVTKKPVVLLHECRENRPIATEIIDIVVLPAAETWKDGVLLPASFVFQHHLNKNKLPNVYADVIVAHDRAPHIKDIMDLRGHRCAIPDKRDQFSAGGLLFKHLHSKGENMIFFGNILDARTQLQVLEMVANKQAEVGILESPVIKCHKYSLPGMDSLHILASMGPLPPYRIMVKETLAEKFNEQLTIFLLEVNKYEEWIDRLCPFGVIGFAKNSMDNYKVTLKKHIITNVPYY